jgi:hypothetical protein
LIATELTSDVTMQALAANYESEGRTFESFRARHRLRKPLFSGNNPTIQ